MDNIEKKEKKGKIRIKLKIGTKIENWEKKSKMDKVEYFRPLQFLFCFGYLVRLSISVFCKPKFANVQKKEGVFGGEF